MRIWLDDERPAPHGYVRTRTVEATIEILEYNYVEEVHLDNDLGDEYVEGRKVVDWIEQAVANNIAYNPPKIHCHSDNAAARAYMVNAVVGIAHLLSKRYYKEV